MRRANALLLTVILAGCGFINPRDMTPQEQSASVLFSSCMDSEGIDVNDVRIKIVDNRIETLGYGVGDDVTVHEAFASVCRQRVEDSLEP